MGDFKKWGGGGSGFYPSTSVYSRFFPKIEFSYCLHKNAFSTHFLALKHTLSIAVNTDEYYSLVIKYTKSHHPNLCIKVGNTALSLPCWCIILIFFVTIHDSVSQPC